MSSVNPSCMYSRGGIKRSFFHFQLLPNLSSIRYKKWCDLYREKNKVNISDKTDKNKTVQNTPILASWDLEDLKYSYISI